MPQRNYPKKRYEKKDFAKKHRDKVKEMYEMIKECKRMGRAGLIDGLELTPTKFYFVQRDCLELNPIQYDKKVGLYSLELIPKCENSKTETEITIVQSDLAKIQRKSGHEATQQEKDIMSAFTKKSELEKELTV